MESVCYKLLVVLMFELPVYSMITWVEDAGVVLAGKSTTFTSFSSFTLVWIK